MDLFGKKINKMVCSFGRLGEPSGYIWVFPKIRVFHFHYFHHPFWDSTIFGNTFFCICKDHLGERLVFGENPRCRALAVTAKLELGGQMWHSTSWWKDSSWRWSARSGGISNRKPESHLGIWQFWFQWPFGISAERWLEEVSHLFCRFKSKANTCSSCLWCLIWTKFTTCCLAWATTWTRGKRQPTKYLLLTSVPVQVCPDDWWSAATGLLAQWGVFWICQLQAFVTTGDCNPRNLQHGTWKSA